MPIRWVVSPVVTAVETDEDGNVSPPFRVAKVATLVDPGTGRRYRCSSAIDAANFALTFVRGVDMSAINADAQCIDLLEVVYEDEASILDATPTSLGWNAARLTRIRNRLIAKGVDVTGITATTPIRAIVERLGRAIHANFHAGGTWVR